MKYNTSFGLSKHHVNVLFAWSEYFMQIINLRGVSQTKTDISIRHAKLQGT
jgi:hypothetical protein